MDAAADRRRVWGCVVLECNCFSSLHGASGLRLHVGAAQLASLWHGSGGGVVHVANLQVCKVLLC